MTRNEYIKRVRQLCKDDACTDPLFSLLAKAGTSNIQAGNLLVSVAALTPYGATSGTASRGVEVSAGDTVDISIARVPAAIGYRIYAGMDAEVPDITWQKDIPAFQDPSVTVSLSILTVGIANPGVDSATSHLPVDSYGYAVDSARDRYEALRPCMVSDTVILTNGVYAQYDLPADFIAMERIQFPAVSVPPTYLETSEYYIDDINRKWAILDSEYLSGTSAIIYYKAKHSWVDATSETAEVDTIPQADREALCLLAASSACLEIAAGYSHKSNQVIGSETVDYKLRADDFRKMSTAYDEQAKKLMGPSPSCGFANWGWYPEHRVR